MVYSLNEISNLEALAACNLVRRGKHKMVTGTIELTKSRIKNELEAPLYATLWGKKLFSLESSLLTDMYKGK